MCLTISNRRDGSGTQHFRLSGSGQPGRPGWMLRGVVLGWSLGWSCSLAAQRNETALIDGDGRQAAKNSAVGCWTGQKDDEYKMSVCRCSNRRRRRRRGGRGRRRRRSPTANVLFWENKKGKKIKRLNKRRRLQAIVRITKQTRLLCYYFLPLVVLCCFPEGLSAIRSCQPDTVSEDNKCLGGSGGF